MSQKIIIFNPDECGGCRTCEMVCSWSHNIGVIRPSLSRVHVLKEEKEGLNFAVFCQQCEVPPCVEACPVDAMSKDKITGAILINEEDCIGCKLCFRACHLGAIGIDTEKKIMIKCDLCGGNPQCVKWCPRGALCYVRPEIANLSKQRSMFESHIFDGYLS